MNARAQFCAEAAAGHTEKAQSDQWVGTADAVACLLLTTALVPRERAMHRASVQGRAILEGDMAADARKEKRTKSEKSSARRVVAVGKWTGDRWLVRTSMWRYISDYVVSKS
jgi:hypothetical protein